MTILWFSCGQGTYDNQENWIENHISSVRKCPFLSSYSVFQQNTDQSVVQRVSLYLVRLYFILDLVKAIQVLIYAKPRASCLRVLHRNVRNPCFDVVDVWIGMIIVRGERCFNLSMHV